MSKRIRVVGIAAILAGLMTTVAMQMVAPAKAAEGRHRDLLGGVAAGLVGGVLLDRAIQGNHRDDAPEPAPVYVEPQPVYVRPVRVVPDPYYGRMSHLKAECDNGDTADCIRFGILIGQHKEREAQWRRQHPDMFAWDAN